MFIKFSNMGFVGLHNYFFCVLVLEFLVTFCEFVRLSIGLLGALLLHISIKSSEIAIGSKIYVNEL